ncbi:DUF397 domain-containing protein [Nocardia uniformis]|uniref:DUF397 domain-containing protein n=1 Tax=Nocardia uniformis TaxID=53432 RepID=A0A849CCL4_9NOCA|nr:DUF397 domain-containing protein [Nocardia uniformis]NNH73817.1 DUF397 domain-containing protein [Nocardia uniformis]
MSNSDRLHWRKSSYSGAGENCVEVAPAGERVYLRHSKRPDDGTITFTKDAWVTLLSEVGAGRPSANGTVTVSLNGTGTLIEALDAPVTLHFDQDEWRAFLAATADGEFDFPL